MIDRTSILQSLIRFDRPLPEITEILDRLGWDSEHEIVTIESKDLFHVLNRYLEENISGVDVESWANAVESREDIGFEPGREELLEEAIYQIANPDLTEPLTTTLAREILDRLRPVSVRADP